MYQVAHNDTARGHERRFMRCPCVGRVTEYAPRKFAIGLNNTFATWGNGSAVTSSQLGALLGSAVFKRGLNTSAYSLSSLRAGGATSLHLSTMDVELVAMVGEMENEIDFGIPLGKPPTARWVGDLMVANPQTLHRATKRLDIQ